MNRGKLIGNRLSPVRVHPISQLHHLPRKLIQPDARIPIFISFLRLSFAHGEDAFGLLGERNSEHAAI
jgi:hypothetical protein